MSRHLVLVLMLLPATGLAQTPDWPLYDEVLIEHVHPGVKDGLAVNLVDYPALKADPQFKELVGIIRHFPVETLDGKKEKLAFYINAYNVLTIRLILDHWPVKSIKDIGGFFNSP